MSIKIIIVLYMNCINIHSYLYSYLIYFYVTRGDRDHNERLAFIFNNQRVKLLGLACEVVIPDEQP